MGAGDDGWSLFFASAVVVEVIAYFIIDSFVSGGCVNVVFLIGVGAVIVDDDGLGFGFERWGREGRLRLFRERWWGEGWLRFFWDWQAACGGGEGGRLHGSKNTEGGGCSQPDAPLPRSSGEA